MRRLLPLLLLICFVLPARADDLAEIKAMLEPLRVPAKDMTRGAKPVFTPIKHRLRAWVGESQLALGPRDFLEDYIQVRWPKIEILNFQDAIQRCGSHGDIWQFGLQIGTVTTDDPLFFAWVRWHRPNTFKVLGFGSTPRADCLDVSDEDTISLPPPLQATESYWGPPVTYHENSAP